MPHRFHHAVTMTSSVQVVRDGAGHRGDDRPARTAQRRGLGHRRRPARRLHRLRRRRQRLGGRPHRGGGTFCAGADLKALAEGDPARVAPDGPGPMGPTRLELSKPVIAAVEGHAVAGGLELALWCDLRVAATDAVLGVFCRRFGVPLVDGGTVRLPRLIGQSHALDLILTGRDVGAEEALAMGLVNRVVPDGTALDHAVALAHELAAPPPDLPAQRPPVGAGAVGAARARRPGGRDPAGARQPGLARCRLGSGPASPPAPGGAGRPSTPVRR